MPNFKVRSEEEEIMDDFAIDDDGLHRTLRELEIINQWLGGNTITLRALKKVLAKKEKRKMRIADLGCGSGDMLRLIHDNFGEAYDLELIGFDANPAVIRHAEEKNQGVYPITYFTENVFNTSFQQHRFDVVLCTLFLHHFEETQLIHLLAQLKKQTKLALLINDLHRHPLAYHSIHWLTALFSRSYMTRYDAKLSVLRAFSHAELQEVLQKSGWKIKSMQWKWAFRWEVIAYA